WVGALLADAADEPLRVAVRPGRPRWDLDEVDAFGGEHGVERGGELRVPVADQEPKRSDPLPHVVQWVAGLLDDPRPGRVRGYAQDVHPPGGDLHHDQYIQPE